MFQLNRFCLTGVVALMSGLFALAPSAFADVVVPALAIQGAMTSNSGGPVADGKYAVQFKLYDAPDLAGQVLFSEAKLGLQVVQGGFATVLGLGDAGLNKLPDDLFAKHATVWIGVAVGGESEMPRQQIQPVPYAIRAALADKATIAAVAEFAKQADAAAIADEAKVAQIASVAKDVQCTGCVGPADVAPAVLSAENHAVKWAGLPNNVQTAMSDAESRIAALETAIPLNKGKVHVFIDVADAAAMAAIVVPGSAVYRLDSGEFWGRTATKWKRFAFAFECGDGVKDPGEECDDGNLADTDSCVSCKAAVCGDTKVNVGVEQCDDGNLVDTDACVACKNAVCGDGKVYAGIEECDNGANNSDSVADACRKSCKKPKCGDNVVDAGEACDLGVNNGGLNQNCTATCTSLLKFHKNGVFYVTDGTYNGSFNAAKGFCTNLVGQVAYIAGNNANPPNPEAGGTWQGNGVDKTPDTNCMDYSVATGSGYGVQGGYGACAQLRHVVCTTDPQYCNGYGIAFCKYWD